ncbi:MAG: DUF61 family protein [Ignisphaera sp.]
MDHREDLIIRGLIVGELRVVNKHLPKERLSLHRLIEMEIPHVILRDGTIHFFRKTELKVLANYIEQNEWDKLLLPIIIIIRPDIDNGIAVVEDSLAIKVIARILGTELSSKNMKRLILYKPHLALLRSLFDTVFQYAISVNLDSDKEPSIE